MSITPQAPIVLSGPPVPDHFEEIAFTKLWSLIPEVYRTADSVTVDGDGPLQELCQRLAVQLAVIRRSIDRLWEDQSIEGCEDWVIPYIGALLDTNLVPAMDARGQRLDVANTINFRRRKGTLSLIEELAADVTGWECRAVEFFRRLTRRRHNLDPAIGRPADAADPAGARQLQRAELLTGLLTDTPAGGYADLRNAAGAQATGSAFDEYSHRLDVRPGHGALGWYGIPKLGLFLWRSPSIAVPRATPVAAAGCPGYYGFDPTGRQIALWQADDRPENGYGDGWLPLAEWQVPGPVSQLVYNAILALDASPQPDYAWPDSDATLWPQSLAVSPLDAGYPLPQTDVTVWTEVGRFALRQINPPAVEVSYHYGLPGLIGAGPYDRRQVCVEPAVDPLPVTSVAGGSDLYLSQALAAINGSGTVVITDGLTSGAVSNVGSSAAPAQSVSVRAADAGRAVIRLPSPGSGSGTGAGPEWVFQGPDVSGTGGAQLHLEGLLLSGGDIVLTGRFTSVTISCCSFDPGSAGDLLTPPATWLPAVDGQPLTPTRLWIEGSVETLTIDRSILGPIRTRLGGVTEAITVTGSIVQGLPAGSGASLTADAVFDADGLFGLLKHQRDPLASWLAGQLTTSAAAVGNYDVGSGVSPTDLGLLVDDLNGVIHGPSVWDAARFADRPITDAAIALAEQSPPPSGAALAALNRRLLNEAFPVELHDAAIATATGLTTLCQTTVLGWGYVHGLECSESILDDVFMVDDPQGGCTRFSAWSQGSSLPRRYECVEIAPGAPVFESRRFGESFYGQVSDGADSAIVGSNTAGTPSIRAGSQGGSEMGAFCSSGAAVKESSLLIKLDEYMPVGMTPVLIPMPQYSAQGETERGMPWPPT